MTRIEKYFGRGLSCYRTLNHAEYFIKITSPADAIFAFEYARDYNLKTFVLGGGSNVFFKNSRIKSLILKNDLPHKIEPLGGNRFEVSSSVMMMELLKYAYENSRDACYYLSSAPCQVGGAIAMNAGSGRRENKSISDFIESVQVLRNGKIENIKREEIPFAYRHSPFADSDQTFIISAIFNFPRKDFIISPITERLNWARENQDLTVPNCGSLCNTYNANIMKLARAVFRPLGVGISFKKLNWGYNKATSPLSFKIFLLTLDMLHKVFNKKIKYEIKIVD